jgi:hypothetical protein
VTPQGKVKCKMGKGEVTKLGLAYLKCSFVLVTVNPTKVRSYLKYKEYSLLENFEFVAAVLTRSPVSWDMTPLRLVYRYLFIVNMEAASLKVFTLYHSTRCHNPENLSLVGACCDVTACLIRHRCISCSTTCIICIEYVRKIRAEPEDSTSFML